MTSSDTAADDWWDDRLKAMESVFGAAAGTVWHAVVPFQFGYEINGRADVVQFPHHVPGSVDATCELIGVDEWIPNRLGNYELAILPSR